MAACWARSMLFLFLLSIWQPGAVHLLRDDCDLKFDGYCYKSHRNKRGSYYDALANCTNDGGRLMNISSTQIRRKLAEMLNSKNDYGYRDSYYNRYWINNNSSIARGDCMIWNPSTGVISYERCDYYQKYACEYGGESCPVDELQIPNGVFKECHSGKDLPYKTVVNIECVEGYILEGSGIVSCTTDGTWSSIPKCVPGCSTPESVNYATLISAKDKYFIGETATYICQTSFYSSINPMETHISLTCNNDSTWIPSPISCEKKHELRIQTVNVKIDQSFILHCDMNELDTRSGNADQWKWLKDSKHEILSFFNATVSPDSGDLTIRKFSEEMIGTYICMHTGNKTCIGKTAYYVREAVKCDPYSNETEFHALDEGSSAYLYCEYSNPQADIIWTQNGVILMNQLKKQILPDGTLFFPMVDKSITGKYSCTVRNRISGCEYIKKMAVSVNIAAKSICGQTTLSSKQPWTVSLWWYDEVSPFCYGVIIDRSWVLTTAHCLTGFNRKRNPKVYIQLGDSGNYSRRIAIESVIAHRRFNPRLYVNDIGLVKLKEKINFDKLASPICITPKEIIPENNCNKNSSLTSTVSGWGSLDNTRPEEFPSLFQESMNIITSAQNTTCQYKYPYSKSIICSERVHKGQDPFAADSGSPLVIPWKGRIHLLGVYSWGERGAYNEAKEYFTKVSDYIYWIKSYLETY